MFLILTSFMSVSFCFRILHILDLILITTSLYQSVVLVGGDCRLFHKRSSKMTQLSVKNLRAAKLLETKMKTKVSCTSQCTAMANCYYMTVDMKNNICMFYNQGSNNYNTTNLQTFVLELTKTEVCFWDKFLQKLFLL